MWSGIRTRSPLPSCTYLLGIGVGKPNTFRPFDRCLLLGKSRRKRTESLDAARILEASFVRGANQIKNSVPRLIDSNPQRKEKEGGGEVDSLYVILTHKVVTFDPGPKEYKYRCFSLPPLHYLADLIDMTLTRVASI